MAVPNSRQTRKEVVFIWRDKNVHNSFNSNIFGSEGNNVHCATTTEQAIQLINRFKQSCTVYVITNGGDNAQDFVHTVRHVLNVRTELVVFCSAVQYHKTWASNYSNVKVLNGNSNLKNWVNKMKREHAASVYFQRALNFNISGYFQRALNLNAPSDQKDNDYDVKSTTNNAKLNMSKNGLKPEDFEISNGFSLKIDDKLKSGAIRDESGYNVIPMTSKPVLSLELNLSYDKWNSFTEQQFLSDFATELGVKPEQLAIICKSRGSIHLTVLVSAVVTQYHGIPITCAYIEDKARSLRNSSSLKRYCIKSAEIEDWFNKKMNDNTVSIMNDVNTVGIPSGLGLSKTEKWILNQTKALKSSLEIALNKLNDKYVVSAVCILDNDDAFKHFVQHSDIEQSILLFHGTTLDALGSIYKTGLRHGGGAVYGHGSYLTSSPLHSINYMICYKTGRSANGAYTLIAAYVNCGKVKEVYTTSYNQKEISHPYDTHYIAKVGSAPNKKYLGYPIAYIQQHCNERYRGETADEYAIKDVTRILPRFYITLSKIDHELKTEMDIVDGAEYNITVFGSPGVNESALTLQYVYGRNANQLYDPTIEDSYRKLVVIDGHVCLLDILDTSGQEEYAAMRSQFITEAQIYIIVYSITNRDSFEEAISLRDRIRMTIEDERPIVLVGNHCDLEEERVVSTEEGRNLVTEWGNEQVHAFFEASVKLNINIVNVFEESVRLCWRSSAKKLDQTDTSVLKKWFNKVKPTF
eukprot:217572_1